MKKAGLLVTVLVLLAASGLVFAAEENVAELKIDDMPIFVNPGTVLDFTFSAGNRVGPGCNAEISYWIEGNGERFSEGQDSFYLEEGQVREGQAKILIPSRLKGVNQFQLEMRCNDAVVLANKPIEVRNVLPVMPLIKGLDITEGGDGEQTVFKYVVESNDPNQVAIQVEEKVFQGGKVVWQNVQNFAVAGERQIESFGPVLGPGTYSLSVEASRGNETAAITREFKVKAAVPPTTFPLVPFAAMAAVLAVMAFASLYFFNARRKHYRPDEDLAVKGAYAVPEEPKAEEDHFVEPKQSVCLVESDQAGVLGFEALDVLLDNAGFSEERKEKAFEVANNLQVVQSVRSCVFTARHEKMSFETIITITIPNNSNKLWHNVQVVASVPDFLVGCLEEVSSDTKMEAEEVGAIFKFKVESIGAMQSASIVYRAEKLVSQDEADRVQLPAVVDFKEGKRVARSKVKVKKKRVAAIKSTVSKKRARKKAARKKHHK